MTRDELVRIKVCNEINRVIDEFNRRNENEKKSEIKPEGRNDFIVTINNYYFNDNVDNRCKRGNHDSWGRN